MGMREGFWRLVDRPQRWLPQVASSPCPPPTHPHRHPRAQSLCVRVRWGKSSASQGAGRDASPGRALPLFFVLTSEGILKVGGQDPPSAMLGLQGLTSNKFSNRFLQALYPLTWILTDSVAPRGL